MHSVFRTAALLCHECIASSSTTFQMHQDAKYGWMDGWHWERLTDWTGSVWWRMILCWLSACLPGWLATSCLAAFSRGSRWLCASVDGWLLAIQRLMPPCKMCKVCANENVSFGVQCLFGILLYVECRRRSRPSSLWNTMVALSVCSYLRNHSLPGIFGVDDSNFGLSNWMCVPRVILSFFIGATWSPIDVLTDMQCTVSPLHMK